MDTLADTLWNEFAVETEEHLQAVEPILTQADPKLTAAADVAQLFRSFHSIKGLARAMDVLGMEAVAHHAENLLGLVREGRAALSLELADLLLQSVDALKRMRDAVSEHRGDMAPDAELIARLAAAFGNSGGGVETIAETAAPVAASDDSQLHEDPEMLAIFVEMIKARGPELCSALAGEPTQRETAADAAETLTHAAEVMNFDALADSFSGLGSVLRSLAAAEGVDELTRQDLALRLADIRLQIEMVGEITGQDAGTLAFSDALAAQVGDDRRRLALSVAELNKQLQEHAADADLFAAEADAAAITRLARTLHGITTALSLTRTADLLLLIEDLYGRVASGEIEAADRLIEAADEVFVHIVERAETATAEDLAEEEALELTNRLREPLASSAARVLQREGQGRLVAGLHIPSKLLGALSDDNLAELERGIAQDELAAYEILVHLEADTEIAERLIGWLTREARAITNRTVVTEGESWFEFLALSALDPPALAAALMVLDPLRHCVKRVRRLTEVPSGELVLDQSGVAGVGADPAAAPRPNAATNLIRVRGETVDGFLDEIGEMRVMVGTLSHLIRGTGSRGAAAWTRGFADRLPRELRNEFMAKIQETRERDRRLIESEELLSGLLSRLHQSALELRVVPVDVVFNRLPRMVRDLAQQEGKSIELLLEGRDVRIDKSMVEALADPLIHMVRNAIDHGIEIAAERRRAGKPERARLTVRASQRGSEIHIEVSDDGRGLDPDAIRSKAITRGLVPAAHAATLPNKDVFHFIFEAGLSTASTVTETSGRGVGMDIVLATVRRLNGDIAIRSERGQGTTFTLVLPVSAALQTALIVRVGDQSLAIPERHVVAVTEVEAHEIRLVGAHRSILHREAVLPLYGLGDLLGMQDGAPPAQRPLEPVIVTSNGRQMIGLEVDAIERRQELFLKDLDPRLARFPGIGGASVLGDGRVVLVLDGEELIQLAARGIDRSAGVANRLAS
ncbi:MAG TPA: chemotaxis protein CheW [Stellaceae bacterium]|jgi:chemotaxis protein histidine kinase CheA|nr:chemotaxis protein CheW [Stellaceae bacterium]